MPWRGSQVRCRAFDTECRGKKIGEDRWLNVRLGKNLTPSELIHLRIERQTLHIVKEGKAGEMMDSAVPRNVRVQSAMLTREFSHDVTGDALGGVFSEVTPLGDLRTGRSGETKCYAYLQLIGVMPGDVIGLRIVDSGGGLIQSNRCPLEKGFRTGSSLLPFTLVVPLTIPHFVYGLHQLIIDHDGVEIGSIAFEVKPMPNPFE